MLYYRFSFREVSSHVAGGGVLTICKWVTRSVAVLYVAALVLFAIGTFGLFGQEQDPLAGVFLVPLGLPWNLWLDGVPDAIRPGLIIFAPALNLLLLTVLCRGAAASRFDR